MSSVARFDIGQGVWRLYLPLPPVPAARHRVGRHGTYYPKTYTTWMWEASAMLMQLKCDAGGGPPFITRSGVYVEIMHAVRRPPTTKRFWPRGDVDNFTKATLDAITKSKLVWADDDQVLLVIAEKRFACAGEAPHTYVRIYTERQDQYRWMSVLPSPGDTPQIGEDVYDLPADRRVTHVDT